MPDITRFRALARRPGICVTAAASRVVTEKHPGKSLPDQFVSGDVTAVTTENRVGWNEEEWRAAFEERAGVLEFDGPAAR
jgi:hypothetical protein